MNVDCGFSCGWVYASFGSGRSDAIGLNKAFEGSKVLNIIVKGIAKDMRFTYHYKIGETFGELNDKMRDSLISMDRDVSFKMNDSYIEYWQTISSVCDDTHNTIYVIPKLMGGGTNVKKHFLKKKALETSSGDEGIFKSACIAS